MATVQKRSDNSYRITVSCGYDRNGKQIRKTKTIKLDDSLTVRQQEKELQKQIVMFEQEVETGTYLDGEKITFEEFVNVWLKDYAEKNLAPSTLFQYKSRLDKRILPALGHLKLSKIQPQHLMSFYNNISEDGIRLDAKCLPSENTIKLINEKHEKCMHEKIGISLKTYLRAKKGQVINYETALKICQYYCIDFSKSFVSNNIDKKLSNKTLKHHHDLISSILSTAVKWNLILNNPAERVEPAKVKTYTAKYYDELDILKLFEALENAPVNYRTLVYLAVDTGLRSGEIAGLKWSDVDCKENTLNVSRQRQYVTGYGVIEKAPKTENGIRYVTMSDTMTMMLKKYSIHQKELKLKLGTAWNDNTDYIFTHEDGTPLHPHRAYTWFTNFIRKNNLKVISFHQLRHTNASLLIADGIDIVTLSGRLGHADKNVTWNTYSHIIKAKEKKAANTMDKFYLKTESGN